MSEANTAACFAGPRVSVEELSDAELLTQTRNLVGRSNRLLAELLAHLGEVEARGIHRTRACSSLYTYCIYELRFSEDEAFRRVAAARLVRRFPGLLEAVATGELHLTGVLMLGPHLTDANFVEVLARAKHRTKRELARLVRILNPLPAVPARIEPLGPPPRVVPGAATWEKFVGSLCPVRELEAGDRPRDWGLEANDTDQPAATDGTDGGALAREKDEGEGTAAARVAGDDEGAALARVTDDGDDTSSARPTRGEFRAPERYAVQFTATEEYVRLVEQAKALLAHAVPNATLDDIHLRAMRAFVAELTKRKYATVRKPHRSGASASEQPNGVTEPVSSSSPRDAAALPPNFERTAAQAAPPPPTPQKAPAPRSTRHIPAAIRRAVVDRDGMRCTYVDERGARCRETHRLEFHHRVPFAVKPEHDVANLTLRCAAHNALAAEEDFGRELMETKTGGHERWGEQAPPFTCR